MTPVKQLFVQFLKSQHSLSIIGEDCAEAETFLSGVVPELKEDVILFLHSEHGELKAVDLMAEIKKAKADAELSGKRIVFVAEKGIPIYLFEGSCAIEVERIDLGDALFNLGKLAYDITFVKCRGYSVDGFEGVTLVQ
ncbi:hypothetical protein MOC16_gp235 [Klebsiella phage vB_KpM_FBKp24]|uniref:Uncharacterized protein n=1 Tax=Klebsiella phage vB_KpM_FBKp24 TaxID=2801834 RepID=A0A7U0GBL6_9CAUD|nr:hypothetical protein [Klebsiella pneumoniae]YP_010298815.1 hypothetical protein MOC16_gp235 [Klebsiella phage vB_KpM_FBKp24]QQV92223.1 hypothetical protein vBKpMFBKp24_178 [Klebsiella phage vB_KpM_FBKp24]